MKHHLTLPLLRNGPHPLPRFAAERDSDMLPRHHPRTQPHARWSPHQRPRHRRQARLPDLRAGRAGDAEPRSRRPARRRQPGRSDLPRGRARRHRRPRARALLPPQHRSRADPDPFQGRPRGRAHGWLGAQRMDAAGGRRRRRQGPAGLAAGLRLQERRARRARGADRALRGLWPQVARDRGRQLGRPDRGLLRARLERRAARRAADRRAHPAHAGWHDP